MYEVFKSLCDAKGVTPYRVAKETNIATSTLTDWKKGRSVPKIEKLSKIADYFGVSVEQIMTGEKSVLQTSVVFDGLMENSDLMDAVSLVLKQDADTQKKIIDMINLMCK